MSVLRLLQSLTGRYYPTSVESAITKARLVAASSPTRYVLGAGGRSPSAPTPFTIRNGRLGSDCIGFTLWCLGLDRYCPKVFPYYEGWINTDSAIMDARGKKAMFEEIDRPELGSMVIFPSIRNKDGKMTRMGHVAIVVEVPAEWPSKTEWASLSPRSRTALLKLVKVIDCNASPGRRILSRAVGLTTAAAMWDKPDRVWVRFRGLPVKT